MTMTVAIGEMAHTIWMTTTAKCAAGAGVVAGFSSPVAVASAAAEVVVASEVAAAALAASVAVASAAVAPEEIGRSSVPQTPHI